MMSTGLPFDQLAGSTACSALCMAGVSAASSTSARAAASAASTPAPPPLVTSVSRSSAARISSSRPRVGGVLKWASVAAAVNSSCSVSTRSMPARRMAASNTMSLPASAPVCEAAACCPCGERPALTTMTGLLRAAARAADMNLRGASMLSM